MSSLLVHLASWCGEFYVSCLVSNYGAVRVIGGGDRHRGPGGGDAPQLDLAAIACTASIGAGATWSICINAGAGRRVCREDRRAYRRAAWRRAPPTGRGGDRPVFARLARRKGRPRGHLHPPLGVDIGRRLLRIRRPRQDHVGTVRAGIAMGADIHDEGLVQGIYIDLIGTEQEENVERVGRGGRDHADVSRPESPGTKPTSRPPTRAAA